MRLLILLFCSCLLVGEAQARTLDSLIKDLRMRSDEDNTNVSLYPDSQAIAWINMAQTKVATFTGGYEQEFVTVYPAGANKQYLPAATRYVKRIFFLYDNVWRLVPPDKYQFYYKNTDTPYVVFDMLGVIVRDTVLSGLAGDVKIRLTERFAGVESIVIQTADMAYAVPDLMRADSASYSGTAYSVSRFKPDSAEIIIHNQQGFMPTTQTFVFDEDSSQFGINVDFRSSLGAMAFRDGGWINMVENPFFAYDTNAVYQFFTSWFDNGSKVVPTLYYSGEFYDGDSLRLSYMRSIADYDTLLIVYNSDLDYNDSINYVLTLQPDRLDTLTEECDFPDREEAWIIEEAYSLYLQAKRDAQTAQANQVLLRQDISLGDQREQE